MKLVNSELNLLRKIIGITDKQSKYLLLKNGGDLNEEQKEKLLEILARSACLKTAYEFKEELRNIYETSKNVKSGQKKMKNGCNLPSYFIKTLAKQFVTIWRGFVTSLSVKQPAVLWKELTIELS